MTLGEFNACRCSQRPRHVFMWLKRGASPGPPFNCLNYESARNGNKRGEAAGRPRDGGFTAAADLLERRRSQIQIYRHFTSHVGKLVSPGSIDGGEHPTVNTGLTVSNIRSGLGAECINLTLDYLRELKKTRRVHHPAGPSQKKSNFFGRFAFLSKKKTPGCIFLPLVRPCFFAFDIKEAAVESEPGRLVCGAFH